jgi:hypothetical protein
MPKPPKLPPIDPAVGSSASVQFDQVDQNEIVTVFGEAFTLGIPERRRFARLVIDGDIGDHPQCMRLHALMSGLAAIAGRYRAQRSNTAMPGADSQRAGFLQAIERAKDYRTQTRAGLPVRPLMVERGCVLDQLKPLNDWVESHVISALMGWTETEDEGNVARADRLVEQLEAHLAVAVFPRSQRVDAFPFSDAQHVALLIGGLGIPVTSTRGKATGCYFERLLRVCLGGIYRDRFSDHAIDIGRGLEDVVRWYRAHCAAAATLIEE